MNIQITRIYGNCPREILTISNKGKASTFEPTASMAEVVAELQVSNLDIFDMTPNQAEVLVAKFGDALEDVVNLATKQATDYYNSIGYTCLYMGVELQIDYETRGRLRARLSAEKAAGKASTVLWFSGMRFELPVEATEQMLDALELYASECFDVKNQHLVNIAKLETVEEILAYDFKAGYPDKPSFGNG